MNIIPGPFGDGFDEELYQEVIQDAMKFFRCSEEYAKQNLQGSKVFKKALQEKGLEYAYDESEGSIWDLLTVKATVSSGIREIDRSIRVADLLDKYTSQKPKSSQAVLDFGCGIGREIVVIDKRGYQTFGVERGLTATFAHWYATQKHNGAAVVVTEDIYESEIPNEYLDAIICLEYFEHDPNPVERVQEFWNKLAPGGLLICNCRSFNPHDTGHLEQNFKYQYVFEHVIAEQGFECLYFPWNPPNIWNLIVFQKVDKDQGYYGGFTTSEGNW